MTRPKVDPEKRQRTANACDSCKRRKQKASRPRAPPEFNRGFIRTTLQLTYCLISVIATSLA